MEETGEVEMKDVKDAKSTSNGPKDDPRDKEEATMELDAVQRTICAPGYGSTSDRKLHISTILSQWRIVEYVDEGRVSY